MKRKQATHDELARESLDWDSGRIKVAGWTDSPEAVPRAQESVPISIRLPKKMLEVIRQFASRENIGYQVLIKRWLDERIVQEAQARRRAVHLAHPVVVLQAASFTHGTVTRLTEDAQRDEFGRLAEELAKPAT
jgi:hypothetical protein